VSDPETLADVPTNTLSRASVEGGGEIMRLYTPVVDGEALPRDPFDPDAPSLSADIPLLIGTNKDETTLFMLGHPRFGDFTEEDVAKQATSAVGDRAPALIETVRAARPDYSPTHLSCAIGTAAGMWRDSITLAERKAAQAAPVWMYRLDWETPVSRGRLRSPHALEIPLVFDTVESARNFVGRGDEPQRLADRMSGAWLAFARTGDPNTESLPKWPPYDAARRATMIFDVESRVVDDPDADVRKVLAPG
jgi:para-nitrobenzyl esterase